MGCNKIKKIKLPKRLKHIKKSTFEKCSSLESVEIPPDSSLKSIGERAFFACENLEGLSENGIEGINLPNSVKKIGKSAFAFCKKISTVILPPKLSYIEDSTFMKCTSLKTIELLNDANLEYIGEDAFNECENLESIITPNKLNEGSVNIPNSVKKIGARAFKFCKKMLSIVLPENLQSIQDSTFEDCISLVDVTFPQNLQSIGQKAFGNCSQLIAALFPESLNKFGEMAFCNCPELTYVVSSKNAEWYNENVSSTVFGESTKIEFLPYDEYNNSNHTIVNDENYYHITPKKSTISFSSIKAALGKWKSNERE